MSVHVIGSSVFGTSHMNASGSGSTPPPAGNGLLNDLLAYMKMLAAVDSTGNFTFNTDWQGAGDGPAIYSGVGGPMVGEGNAIAPVGHFPQIWSDQVGGVLADWSGDYWVMVWFKWPLVSNYFANTFAISDLVDTGNSTISDIYADRGGAGLKAEWYYGTDYGVSGHQIGSAEPSDTNWHQVNYWWESDEQTMYMNFDGGAEVPMAVANANLLTPNNNNTLSFAFYDAIPRGPSAVWKGRAPTAQNLADIWNGGLGTPYADFTT